MKNISMKQRHLNLKKKNQKPTCGITPMCYPSQHNPNKQNLLWLVKELKIIAKSSNKNSSAASELLCLFCTPQRLEKSSSLLYGPNTHLSKKQQGSWENPECMRTKNTAESPYRKKLDKGLISV